MFDSHNDSSSPIHVSETNSAADKDSPVDRVVASVSVTDEVNVRLSDPRPDALELFGELIENERSELAVDIWRVGVRALSNARIKALDVRFEETSQRLMANLSSTLRSTIEQHEIKTNANFAKYFDPSDGTIVTRLSGLLNDEGEMARLLAANLSIDNSVISNTLNRYLGSNSELIKRLDPAHAEGFIANLQSRIRETMSSTHAEVLRALDPMKADSPVARFLHSVREELKNTEQSREKQLSAATAALDANNENSPLSRLMRETREAHQRLANAINPELPSSPLRIIQESLAGLLNENATKQSAMIQAQDARQAKFEQDMREMVTRLETKRSHMLTSPQGGTAFEDDVFEFVRGQFANGPYLTTSVGTTPGLLPNSKKGDVTLTFTSESAYSGTTLVIEAKRKKFAEASALEELDVARSNRAAHAGVFVMAKSHAAPGFPELAKYGNNVLVIWDETDPASNSRLSVALMLGMSLAARMDPNRNNEGNVRALCDLEARVLKELDRLEEMRKTNEGIRKHTDLQADQIRKASMSLDAMVRDAKDVLTALNSEQIDERRERSFPLVLAESTG